MRKLIRSKKKRAFLTREGSWTRDPLRAREVDVTEAVRMKEQFGLQDVEIYYHFDGDESSEYDFGVPMR